METLKSKTKTRVLPSWMTAPVDERKVVSVKTATRKQTAAWAQRVGAATRAPATETVYCMNEAEMVDVALGILIEVTSVLSLVSPMPGDSSWVGTSTGPPLLVREMLSGCLRSHVFFLLPLLSQVSLSRLRVVCHVG